MPPKYFSPPNIIDPFAVTSDPPQGRLTLTSATPILTANVVAAGTVYYTPFVGNKIPIWNGTNFEQKTFTELSNVLANSSVGSAGPAAGAASKNYYLVVWNNNGVLTLTRSPAWTSDTSPGSGAGTAETMVVQGMRVNTVAITNGPAAGYGTIVGAIRTDSGGATVTWQFGATASGATPGNFHVRNTYNRRRVTSESSTSNAASHNYTSATIQASNADNGMRMSVITDFANDDVHEFYVMDRLVTAAAINAAGFIGIGKDVTNAISSKTGIAFASTAVAISMQPHVAYNDGAIGFHFYSAVEQGDGTNATAFHHSPYLVLGFKGMM